MKLNTIAILGTLIVPLSTTVFGQGQTTPITTDTAVIPGQGSTVNPGTMPTQEQTVDPSVTSTQQQAVRNEQSAQQNTLQANPAQAPQQAGAAGIFGPSKGPGIFGPTSQTVTTDIYGNQQISTGGTVQTNTQGSTGTAAVRPGSRLVPNTRPGQAPVPMTKDINGNTIPSDGQVQNQLPRDLQPLIMPPLNAPTPSQPAQPSSTVTGR